MGLKLSYSAILVSECFTVTSSVRAPFLSNLHARFSESRVPWQIVVLAEPAGFLQVGKCRGWVG